MVVPWVLGGGWHSRHGWARLPTSCKGRWGEQRQGPAPASMQWGFVPQSSATDGAGGGTGAEPGSSQSATYSRIPRAQHPPCAITPWVSHLPLQEPQERLCPGSQPEL